MDKQYISRAEEIQRMAVDYVRQGKSGVPDGSICEMVLFIGMKYLYIAMKENLASKDEVSLEKKKLLVAYQSAAFEQDLHLSETRRANQISLQLAKLRECKCEHCEKLLRIFDGRDRDIQAAGCVCDY